jgi:alpha-glutamyl/putrescinyl thymine pyrophosphorylase clade 1
MDIAGLVTWVRLREALRINKEQLLLPIEQWTDDPILRQYRFCNVRRRDDRVSRWIRANVYSTFEQNDNFLLFSAFCRWNNWPPVIKYIMGEGLYPSKVLDWKAVASVLDRFRKENNKVWTGAYMINAKGAEGAGAKASFVCERVIAKGMGSQLPRIKQAINIGSRHEVWLVLKSLPNWGSFMAGQVVDDWTWTPLLCNATDLYHWAPMGPGSMRGLNRITGRDLNARWREAEWNVALPALYGQLIQELGFEFLNLTAMDVQSCLCEFDKYERVRLGQGRPRSTYKPETAYAA